MDAVNRVAEDFDGLDPKTQNLLLGIGMFLAVIAPLLAIGGSIIGVVAKVATNYGMLFGELGRVKNAGSGVCKVFKMLKSIFGIVVGLLLKTMTGIGGGIRALFKLIMANPFIAIG